MTKPANQNQENDYIHHVDRPILAFSHSGISESSNQLSPTAAGIQARSENPSGPVGQPNYFGVTAYAQPKSNPPREIANKETTITEKTSHTPNTQMLIKGDGSSSGKLNTQLKMKRVPSSHKMDKSKRPKLQAHANNTTFGADDLHSQKSQSKSRDRGSAANHTNGLIPQQYLAQQQVVSVHQAELATNGVQTYVGEPEMVQNFNFVQMGNNQPPFAFSNMTGPQMQLQQWQGQQPQVHFIANKQKFYGISPERAPIIFTQPNAQNIQAAIQNSEKRPYTSSGNAHPKRSQTGTNVKSNNNAAVAAMYLGIKTHQQGFNYNPAAQVRNASQPNNTEVSQLGYQNPSVQQTLSMLQFPSKRQQVNVHNRAQIQASSANNANRKTNPIVSKENEQLYQEVLSLKQLNNQRKEESVKLKTKIKILEAENARKERVIEDFCTQNQFISQAQKNPQLNGQLAPIAQTAQRYQQETYLVMSLKKQVKEIKFELMKKEEEMYNLKKNIKTSHLIEVEHELAAYKDELVRLRFLLENNMQNLAHHASHTSQQTANELQPSVMGKFPIVSSYSDVIRPDQISHGQSQGASQEFSSLHKKEDAVKKQTDGNVAASLGGTHTSGFNIFNSIQDGNAAKVHDDIIAHLNQQLYERDMQIQQLQGIVDEMMLVKDSKVESTSKIEARGVDPEEEKKQKQEMARLKKLVQAKEKENIKTKGEITLLTQKTAQMEEELAKLKQQSQVSTKKQKDLQAELKFKSERIDQLTKDLQSATDAAKTTAEKSKQQVQEIKNLQQNLQELHSEMEMVKQSKRDDAHKSIDRIEKVSTKPDSKLEGANLDATSRLDAEDERKERERTKLLIMRENVFDELNIVCAIIGRKEDLDRVDITHLLKAHSEVSYLECSPELVDFIETCSTEQLAPLIPRYTLGSEERDRQNMHRLRKIVAKKELFEILSEKEKEDSMPFDAVKELCEKFGFAFNDEQCGFICANFLRKIQKGAVFIDFAAFLGALKSDKDKSVLRDTSDVEDGATKTLMTVTADESEIEKATLEGAQKIGKKPVNGKKNLNEEQMLDIAEGCFIKMAELLLIKGRSVRNVFTKYSVPEIFPDRTVLELLSPLSLLEGIKEIGLDDLEEIEAACLMRVLAKPELDNAIILNELVLIMENFGVPDGDEDAEDDYIPDTETDVSKIEEKEETKEDIQSAGLTQKSKKRVYDLKKIDAKGVKILKKLARFLLKQFLHPREFFGKAITKQKIKTKKREFVIDVIKVKDFYLRLKIASIRKRLTENASLNDELCVDSKTHKDIFNVKQMVKALEEIAEEEQILMMKEEALAKEKKMVELTEKAIKEDAEKDQMKLKAVEGESQIKSPEQSLTPTGVGKKPVEGQIEVGKHKTKKQDAPDYYMTSGTEVMRFGSHNAHNRRAGTSVALNTIEEEKHETQTSNYFEGISEKDNSGILNSNHFRYSKDAKEFEFDDDKKDDQKRSAARIPVDIFNKSLTNEDMSRMSATNRSSDDRPEHRDKSATATPNITPNIDILTAQRKKVSQSAVNESHFRGSILNSEVFDSKSDSQETPQKPLQMQKQV